MDASPDAQMLQGWILGRGHFSKYLMAGTGSQAHILRYAAMDLSEKMKPVLLKIDLHPPAGVLSGFRTTKRTKKNKTDSL